MHRLDTAFIWISARPLVAAFVLVATMLLLAGPGFLSLPPVDRDEASFAQASRQMLESGDWVDIRLHDAPRHKKPVGIYWLQAGTAWLTGVPDAIATYRLVSLAGAVVAVLLTWRIAAGLLGPVPALGAGLLMAASFILGAEARLAKTDAVLLATILAGQWGLMRLWTGTAPGRAGVMVFWAALACGVLVKGPVGAMVVGLTALALVAVERRAGWLRPLADGRGVLLFLALVLPWYVLITLRTGGAFWAASVGQDLLAKAAAGQESHGAPPGTYLATFWLAFWPGAALLALALPAMRAVWRERWAVFCLAWVVPTWVVFELVPTKLLHYTMPTFPALAILTAGALLPTGTGTGGIAGPALVGTLWRRAAAALLLALPLVVLGALGVAAVRLGGGLPWPFAAGAVALGAVGWLMWRALARGPATAAFAVAPCLALAFSAGLYPGLARVATIWPSAQAAGVRAAFDACADPEVISAGYGEPSLVFLLGREVRLTGGAEAADLMAASPCALAFVSEAEDAGFAARAAQLGIVPEALPDRIDGLNLGSGRRVRLTAYATTP